MTEIPINRELDVANYEDLCLLSALWEKNDLSNADIRNSSHIVRRLLVYGDLVKSSAPRKQKLEFSAPENSPFIRASRNGLIDFWQSGGTTIFGVWMRGALLHRSPQHKVDACFQGWNPDQVIDLRLDSFLRQEVFGYLGQPATRGNVITYVSNKAGGPHFDMNREDVHSLLDRIRSGVSISFQGEMPCFGINSDNFVLPGNDFLPKTNSIDHVFLELAATCRYISMSPIINRLTESLKNDLGR